MGMGYVQIEENKLICCPHCYSKPEFKEKMNAPNGITMTTTVKCGFCGLWYNICPPHDCW
jgi:uncharacterized protein YbaR (Trm112 family)